MYQFLIIAYLFTFFFTHSLDPFPIPDIFYTPTPFQTHFKPYPCPRHTRNIIEVAERLALPSSDHGAPGSNFAAGEIIYLKYNIGLLIRWFGMIKYSYTIFVFWDQCEYMSVSRSGNCFPNNMDNVVG